jgi:hypothetical protein
MAGFGFEDQNAGMTVNIDETTFLLGGSRLFD